MNEGMTLNRQDDCNCNCISRGGAEARRTATCCTASGTLPRLCRDHGLANCSRARPACTPSSVNRPSESTRASRESWKTVPRVTGAPFCQRTAPAIRPTGRCASTPREVSAQRTSIAIGILGNVRFMEEQLLPSDQVAATERQRVFGYGRAMRPTNRFAPLTSSRSMKKKGRSTTKGTGTE